ncbi:hypothetical protein GCM10022256_15920 [Frondihabitans peucedani]|jgi:hypothetical protein|uniref:Uncharacterized protein n=1 Tax=Frondihabitans peucedani TaxID=598626 RepID=A0ABP8E193_9MICO
MVAIGSSTYDYPSTSRRRQDPRAWLNSGQLACVLKKEVKLMGASVLGSYWWIALLVIAAIVGYAIYNSFKHRDR